MIDDEDPEDAMVAADALEQRGDVAGAARLRLALPPTSIEAAYAALAAALATGADPREAIARALAGARRSPFRTWAAFLVEHGRLITREATDPRRALAQQASAAHDPDIRALATGTGALRCVARIGPGIAETPALAALEGVRPVAIDSLAVHADGTRVFAGYRDGSISEIDLVRGTARELHVALFDDAGCAVALDHRGELLYATCAGTRVVLVFELATGHIVRELPPAPSALRAIAISPSGRFLVGTADELVIWTLASDDARVASRAIAPAGPSCAIVRDDGLIVVGTCDRTIEVIDATTLARIALAQPGRGIPTALALRGDLVAIALLGAIELRALPALAPVATIEWATADALAFAGGDRLLATDRNGAVNVFDVHSGTPRATLQGHAGRASAVDTLPGDRAISAGSDGSVRIWDLAAPATPAVERAAITWLGGTHDHLLVGHEDAPTRCYARDEEARWTIANRSPIHTRADGLALSSSPLGAVAVHDLATGAIVRTLPGELFGDDLALHPTAPVAIGASRIGAPLVWDLATFALRTLAPPAHDPADLPVARVALSGSAAHAIVCRGDGGRAIDIWTLATGAVRRHDDVHTATASIIAIGDRAITWDAAGEVHGWLLSRGERTWSRTCPIERAVIAGDRLAISADTELAILDPATGETRAHCELGAPIIALAATETLIAVLTTHHDVRVLDTNLALLDCWSARMPSHLRFLDDAHLAVADSHAELYVLEVTR